MTKVTAARAKELATYASENRLCEDDGGDVAAALNHYAHMLEAALPESVQKIAASHKEDAESTDRIYAYRSKPSHKHRGILLDAIRILTAECDAARARYRVNVDELIMKWNIATGERDSAHVEVERLNARVADLDAGGRG